MIAVPAHARLVTQEAFLAMTEREVTDVVVLSGIQPTWLVELTDAVEFLAWLQPGFRPPTQGAPSAGLPANVWVGARLPYVGADVRDLLDVRARVRWVETSPEWDAQEGQAVPDSLAQAWRCSNCGTRGEEPRPKICPRAYALCGDARIDPQVHVVMSDGLDAREAAALRGLGISLWPALRTLGIRR